MKHTKIVATVSDIRCEIDFIQKLYDAGMNVARLNTAHMSKEGIAKITDNCRAVNDSIAVLLDTKGPEIRIANNADNAKFDVKIGQRFEVSGDGFEDTLNTPEKLFTSYPQFAEVVPVGAHVLIDDGEVDLEVVERQGNTLICVATNDGEIGSRKSVNVPGSVFDLPSLTDKDRRNIGYGMEKEIDFIAHSFVRNAADVKEIQDILDANNSKIKIIAKIENQEGVDNIDEILECVHGVMVARGDLAIEVGIEKVPGMQRNLIKKCIEAKKPVIVATQMLHTMIKNPRPTRAEVTDIANAIFYRTDALMLSGETAYGDYPIEAVKTMAHIAEQAEQDKMKSNDIVVPNINDDEDVTSFLSKQAVKASSRIGSKAIITDSLTGGTALNLAAFRGISPVYAQCYSHKTMRLLSLSYGIFGEFVSHRDEVNEEISLNSLKTKMTKLIEEGVINKGDTVAYLGGSFGITKNNITPGATFLEFFNSEDINL
jgi:pyruvate kinase